MEYAHSLLIGGPTIHAREVGYEDCREFQIICLACQEPVFKVGSEITKRQYFSHYRRKEDSECELRVRQIVRQYFDPKTVLPQGQELARFLAQFEKIILESGGDRAEEQAWRLRIARMRSRPTFRRMIFDARASGYLSLFTLGGDFEGQTVPPLLPEVAEPSEREAVVTTLRYLLSPNSFRALGFAISFGMIATRAWNREDDYHDAMLLNMIEEPELQLHRWCIQEVVSNSAYAYDAITQALCMTVMIFVKMLASSESGPSRLP